MRAPWLLRRLLQTLAPPGNGDAMIHDLEDEATEVQAARGREAARRWLWWQTIHSIRPLARERLRGARRRSLDAATSLAHGWSTDLKHVMRRLSRAPGFFAVAVLTLALGIGATGAIFSLAYAIWLKPLPFSDPDRLVSVQDVHVGSGATSSLSGPEFADLRNGTHSFAGMAAFRYGAEIGRMNNERLRFVSFVVSPSLFGVLGTQPVLGRTLNAADAGQPVVVLSYATWASRFGRDPGVLTKTMVLSDKVFSIVGVMPPSLRFPDGPESDVWIASNFTGLTERSNRLLQVVARLSRDVTSDAAGRDVAAAAARQAVAYPATSGDWTSRVLPVDRRSASGYGAIFGSLLGLVGLFLLVGCANVAGLLVARNVERRGELAVCASLGASRLRLVRQMAVEGCLLALFGTAGGLALAGAGSHALAAAMPPRLTGLGDVGLSLPVFGFFAAMAAVTAVGCGLVPAIAMRSLSATEALTGARRSGPRSQRLQNVLVVVEVSAAMVLLIGASLMARSFSALLDRDRGFNPHGVLALSVSLPFEQSQFETSSVRAAALESVVARVSQLPGVVSAGATNGFPGSALGVLGSTMLRSPNAAKANVLGVLRSASPGYFSAMGVALTAGRVFLVSDTASSPPVAIVNETLARALWPGQPAVGRQLALPAEGNPAKIEPREVVGVVADMHLGARSPADIFLPVAQRPAFWIDLVVRTNGDPASLAGPVRRAVLDINRDLLIENSTAIDTIVSNSLGLERAQATLASIVGVLSAAVAGVGLYALLAFVVAQRRREIGIRLALGSAPMALAWWIFGRGMRLAGVGIGAGAIVTLVLVRMLRSQVFGFASASAWAFAVASVILVAVAAVSLLAPARRVLRADPMITMRE